MIRDDPPGGHFKRREQRRGTMAPVVMALAGQGAPIRQLQITFRPLQGLDQRLFVEAEDNRLGRRIDMTTSAAFATNVRSLLSHQDLRVHVVPQEQRGRGSPEIIALTDHTSCGRRCKDSAVKPANDGVIMRRSSAAGAGGKHRAHGPNPAASTRTPPRSGAATPLERCSC
jgi:hypothetical protein